MSTSTYYFNLDKKYGNFFEIVKFKCFKNHHQKKK